MNNDRAVLIETWIGWLFMASWGLWHLAHRHQPADRITDYFVGLGALGSLILLHATFLKKRSSQLK